MNSTFQNSNFFDLSSFPHPGLLEELLPWQSISSLTSYISDIFSNGALKPNFKNKQKVFVGEGTIIHPSVEIEGPAIIGKGCIIKHAAYLREGCVIGDNVTIGHAVEIKHSIILNQAMISHLNYIGDSLVGRNVNISGGVIIANFRLDAKNIFIKLKEGQIDTKLGKFGAVIGDNSKIGVNSIINPGTVLGQNSLVYPLRSVSGVHPDNAIIK
jgi:NDP-sugar pyrophosphorylase family protein